MTTPDATPDAPTGAATVLGPTTVDDLRSTGGKLFEAHWREVVSHPSIMRMEPNWKRYYELEERGHLLLVGAWHTAASGKTQLVGYAVTVVTNHSHHENLLLASNDLLFVTRRRRREGTGLRLIRYTERAAIVRGASYVTWHAKPGTALVRVLEHLGYDAEETVYGKEL